MDTLTTEDIGQAFAVVLQQPEGRMTIRGTLTALDEDTAGLTPTDGGELTILLDQVVEVHRLG